MSIGLNFKNAYALCRSCGGEGREVRDGMAQVCSACNGKRAISANAFNNIPAIFKDDPEEYIKMMKHIYDI